MRELALPRWAAASPLRLFLNTSALALWFSISVLLFYTLTRVGQEALPTHGFASALHYSPEFTSVGTSRRCPSRYQVISGTGLPFRLLQVAI